MNTHPYHLHMNLDTTALAASEFCKSEKYARQSRLRAFGTLGEQTRPSNLLNFNPKNI